MAEVKAGQTNAQDKPQDAAIEDADKPAPKTYPQDEVDRIVSRVRKNAARDAELKLRREMESRTPPPQDKKEEPKEEVEPKRDDFETHEDFQRALTRYDAKVVAREERAEAEKADKEKAVREQNEKAASTWKGRIEQAQTKLADFEDVLEDNGATLDVIANAPMRGFITESDIGPQIIYDLCKNPAEATRIAALPRYKQAAEIAKIEERLTAAAKPKEEKDEPQDEDPDTKGAREEADRDDATGRFKAQKETPKADEPIEPVGARPASASAEPSDKDDPATWHRKRVAQIAKRRNPSGK